MSKILITGGSGFIGFHLAMYLGELGHEITICDIEDNPQQRFLEFKREIKDICVYIKELSTIDNFPVIFGNPGPFDIIYHLASIPHIGVGMHHPESTFSNNINTTLSVLGYCRQHPQTKLIFASSGSAKWAEPLSDPHSTSKRMCENIIELFNKTYGTSAVVARIYNVYGSDEANYGSFTPLIKTCKMASETVEPISVYGDGTATRDYIHVSDVVTGLAHISAEMIEGINLPVYELGLGTAKFSVVDIIHKMLGKDWPIVYLPEKPGHIQTSKADKKLRPKHWSPEVKVNEYIEYWLETGAQND